MPWMRSHRGHNLFLYNETALAAVVDLITAFKEL